MRIDICDDEQAFIDSLDRQLRKYQEEMIVPMTIMEASGVMDYIDILDQYGAPDVLFLDIELQDGNGIEIAHTIRNDERLQNTQIVFVSSKQKYAMQLFDLHPMNFLIKNIDYEKLKMVLDDYRLHQEKLQKYVTLSVQRKEYRIAQRSIIYVESIGHSVRIVTVSTEEIFRAKFSELITQLDPENFVQIHKSYIVNLSYVDRFCKDRVMMTNESWLPISRSKRNDVYQKVFNQL